MNKRLPLILALVSCAAHEAPAALQSQQPKKRQVSRHRSLSPTAKRQSPSNLRVSPQRPPASRSAQPAFPQMTPEHVADLVATVEKITSAKLNDALKEEMTSHQPTPRAQHAIQGAKMLLLNYAHTLPDSLAGPQKAKSKTDPLTTAKNQWQQIIVQQKKWDKQKAVKNNQPRALQAQKTQIDKKTQALVAQEAQLREQSPVLRGFAPFARDLRPSQWVNVIQQAKQTVPSAPPQTTQPSSGPRSTDAKTQSRQRGGSVSLSRTPKNQSGKNAENQKNNNRLQTVKVRPSTPLEQEELYRAFFQTYVAKNNAPLLPADAVPPTKPGAKKPENKQKATSLRSGGGGGGGGGVGDRSAAAPAQPAAASGAAAAAPAAASGAAAAAPVQHPVQPQQLAALAGDVEVEKSLLGAADVDALVNILNGSVHSLDKLGLELGGAQKTKLAKALVGVLVKFLPGANANDLVNILKGSGNFVGKLDLNLDEEQKIAVTVALVNGLEMSLLNAQTQGLTTILLGSTDLAGKLNLETYQKVVVKRVLADALSCSKAGDTVKESLARSLEKFLPKADVDALGRRGSEEQEQQRLAQRQRLAHQFAVQLRLAQVPVVQPLAQEQFAVQLAQVPELEESVEVMQPLAQEQFAVQLAQVPELEESVEVMQPLAQEQFAVQLAQVPELEELAQVMQPLAQEQFAVQLAQVPELEESVEEDQSRVDDQGSNSVGPVQSQGAGSEEQEDVGLAQVVQFLDSADCDSN